jgi:RNAse (barnase) inhibitor barstar
MNTTFSELISTGANGVFRCHAPVPDADADAASRKGLKVVSVGLTGARDKSAFLGILAKALAFPDYFGRNWDAFYDCLLELEHGEGTLLVLRDASGFARAEPEEFAAAVDALLDAAAYWEDHGKTLLTVVELDAPVLAPDLPEVSVQPS